MNAENLTRLLGECWHEIIQSIAQIGDLCSCGESGRFGFRCQSNRTFDNPTDIAFAIGKLKEMGLLRDFQLFLIGVKGWLMTGSFECWLSLSFTEQAELIEEFLTTREQEERAK